MRVSTQSFFQNSIATLQRLQSDLNGLQEQIATGRRIQRPSDDPVGAARSLDLQQSIDTLTQYQSNTGLVQTRLQLEEQTLGEFTNLLQRTRELALQASNATQTPETRSFIAAEIRQNIDAALAFANTRDASDNYLFGGYQTGTQPFTRDAAGFNYNGDQGQRLIQVSRSRQIADSDPGDKIFGRIREGNGQFIAIPGSVNGGTGVIFSDSAAAVPGYNYERYSISFTAADAYEVRDSLGALVTSGAYESGNSIAFNDLSFTIDGAPEPGDSFSVEPSANTDVFTIMSRIADALEGDNGSATGVAQVSNALNRGISGIDQALTQVLKARTNVGARLNVAEAQVAANSGVELVLRESLADIEDLDYAEAISALSQQATALEAAQQSFVRVQGLSLFNFL